MIQNQLQVPPEKKRFHWPSLLVLLNAALGLMFFGGIAVIMLLSGLMAVFNRKAGPEDITITFSYSAAGVLLGALLLPSIVLAFKRLSGQAATSTPVWELLQTLFHPKRLIWLYPLILLAGVWINTNQRLSWLMMPVINLFALGVPIALLIWAGTRRLTPSSPQRTWSVFGIGITTIPLLIIILEFIFMIVGFFVVAFFVSIFFEGAVTNINDLLFSFTEMANGQEIPAHIVAEFIRQPIVLTTILMFVSGLIPLIEELIKPAAILLLWKTPLTPQDGWRLGLLGGAGFALIESLGNTTVGEDWVFLILGRAGASALHMFNTGIISYTFVLSREKKRLLPVLLALLGTILIHGLWNGITIFATISSLETGTVLSGVWPTGFMILLAVIALGLVGGILAVNQRLYQRHTETITAAASESTLPEPDIPEKTESEQ